MSDPFVSICVPTYNGEEFLRECMESCLNQVYDNYEIVVCDDCSSDSTRAILSEFSKRSTRVRFFKNEKNLGLVGNWNKCLEEARGGWIKFVFQDDYITPDCLSEFVKAIEKDTRLLVSQRNFILPDNASEGVKNYYSSVVRTLKNTSKHSSVYFPPDLISKLAVKNMAMNFIAEPSLAFFRKDVTNEIGSFNHSLKQICDFEFLLRLSSQFGLKYLDKPVCVFRIHNNTTTQTNIANNFYALKYIEPLLLAYFLLYDRQFLKFRSHITFLQSLKLRLYFRLKAFQAYSANSSGKHNHPLFQKGKPGFKEIRRVKRGSLLIRLLARFLG